MEGALILFKVEEDLFPRVSADKSESSPERKRSGLGATRRQFPAQP